MSVRKVWVKSVSWQAQNTGGSLRELVTQVEFSREHATSAPAPLQFCATQISPSA